MARKLVAMFMAAILSASMITGCGTSEGDTPAGASADQGTKTAEEDSSGRE